MIPAYRLAVELGRQVATAFHDGHPLTTPDPLTAFGAAWERSFLLAPPVGYRMRELYPARWLRIHSLPDSKRYAENDPDYAELLARHNAVASDLFGEGGAVVLVCHRYAWPDEAPAPVPPELPAPGGELRLLRRAQGRELHPHADGEEDAAVELWALPSNWRAGAFDSMIRRVADDQGPTFVLSTPDAERVYAPYDGGADLFLERRSVRDVWKQRYAAWLSAHPSGL